MQKISTPHPGWAKTKSCGSPAPKTSTLAFIRQFARSCKGVSTPIPTINIININ